MRGSRGAHLLIASLVALALAGCGADDAPEPAQGTGPDGTAGTTAGETAPGGATGTGGDGPGAGGESGAAPAADGSVGDADSLDPSPPGAGEPPKGGGTGGVCEYGAPPGRLGNRTVSIELAGASCATGRRLARAAALGQPAGANIPVSSQGFRCVPSTRERGVNVVYSCSNGPQRASFEIEWTAG